MPCLHQFDRVEADFFEVGRDLVVKDKGRVCGACHERVERFLADDRIALDVDKQALRGVVDLEPRLKQVELEPHWAPRLHVTYTGRPRSQDRGNRASKVVDYLVAGRHSSPDWKQERSTVRVRGILGQMGG